MKIHQHCYTVNYNTQLLEELAILMKSHPRYGLSECVVKKIFSENPGNKNEENVLIKSSILNTLYSTSIFNIIDMARHIFTIENLDELLSKGKEEAIKKIRSGHTIFSKNKDGTNGKEFDFYSFATKYCSFHNPERYPIYDNYVSDFLISLNKKLKFSQIKTIKQTKNYNDYKELIDDFIYLSKSKILAYKEVDKALWILSTNIKDKEKIFYDEVIGILNQHQNE